MAKRTVTRWVSERAREIILAGRWLELPRWDALGAAVHSSGFPNRLDLVLDDGEPDGKCPCDNGGVGPCCQFQREPYGHDCCRCHATSRGERLGTFPCLSDWHKKAGPESAAPPKRPLDSRLILSDDEILKTFRNNDYGLAEKERQKNGSRAVADLALKRAEDLYRSPEQPRSETEDRVVEGFMYGKSDDAPFGNFLKKRPDGPGDVAVTVTIHAPKRGQTLVEAVEALLRIWDAGPPWDSRQADDVRAALAREKAKVSRP